MKLKVHCKTLLIKWRPLTKMLTIMKLTAIILLAFCLQVSAKGYTQTVTFSLRNASVQRVFKEIFRQTGVSIVYNEKLFEKFSPVSLDVKDVLITEVMNRCLKNQPFTYSLENNAIIIRETPPATQIIQPADSIPKVYGRVVDEVGQPLVNVSVVVKDTKSGTATVNDGSFSINAQKGNVLVVSFVGYLTQELPVGSKTNFNIVLTLTVNKLTDVVVTGYSSQRKKDITGSVSVIDMKAMKSIPTGSGEQALQGMASGVTIISSGAPGGESNIFIRGVSSFGSTQPLIIVDGVPASLHDININDIESVQILKDAGSAAIYGVRGSNGVIVVTTKKGKSGEPTISYDSYYGNQIPLKGNVFNLLNSNDFATLVKKVNPNTNLFANGLPDYIYAGPGIVGTAKEGDSAIVPSNYNFDPANPDNDYLIQRVNKKGTDWFHEIFKSAPMQSHNLTASGGTDKSKYLFSFGYLDQKGTLIETSLKRYSTRINTQFTIKKNIRLGENAYIFLKENPGFSNQSTDNVISFAYRTMPIIPVYDIKGNYGGTWAGPELGNAPNPYASQSRTHLNKNRSLVLVGNIYAEIDLFKHFMGRTSFGGTINDGYSHSFSPNAYNDKEFHNGVNSFNEGSQYDNSWTWTNTLTYTNRFDKHTLKILGGSEAINSKGRGVGGGANNFFSTSPAYLVLSNGTSSITNYSYAYDFSLYSIFSRLDYAYDDRYLFSATVRRDGSSQFGPEKRFGIFPSFSVGWRVSNQAFLKDVTQINDFKIRGSWGKLGSQNNVGSNNAYTLFNSNFQNSYYDINGTSNSTIQGFYRASNGNPKTGWEQDIITNIGFDATIFNKVDLSVEWYKKSINGLLFPQPLPLTAGGADAPIINIGDIQNKGWDITAAYHGGKSGQFQFNIGVNVTAYKNRVVNIPGEYFDIASSSLGNLVRNQVGHPVGSFFGYQVERLFRDDKDVSSSPTQEDAAPGRFKYRDTNGDGKITPDDRTFFGNPNPDFTYGLNLGANYKGFDFSAIFYGSQGNDVLNHVRYYTDFFGSFIGGKSNDLLYNSWNPQNLAAKTPKAELSNTFSTSGVANSYYMENGSFLKCRSLILGYTINPTVLKRLGINRFRAYIQAANLFTITKYKGLDPELSGSSSTFGIDYGNYPNNQKNLIVGLNLSF